MERVVHFEMFADQPDRAAKFYSDIFGWKFQKWDGNQDYWLITTGEEGMGINGGMANRMSPEIQTINTIGVASVDECVGKVTEAGGSIMMPKTTIPGIGYLAYCRDTEGNAFGIMQPDMSAQ
ncbi:MAG: putative glyoxalase/bleomycin resistance domain protein [Chlorobi bacterium]|nr:putative glyoxalase/bleomycin resistance domain protein [Chlorobiota bacterium]